MRGSSILGLNLEAQKIRAKLEAGGYALNHEWKETILSMEINNDFNLIYLKVFVWLMPLTLTILKGFCPANLWLL